MPEPRDVIAAWEWTVDDAASLQWAEVVIAALAAAGLHLCSEGQAVVDGEVVALVDRGPTVMPSKSHGYTTERRFAIKEAPDA